MNCEELQLNIALYDDDVLSESERERLDEHLQICPLCRLRLANNREVVREFHRQSRPEAPAALQNRIRAAVAAEIGAGSITGATRSTPRRSWIQTWLMPSTVGSFATVLIGLTVLSSMFTRVTVDRPAGLTTGGTVFLNSSSGSDTIPDSLTPSEYARQRLDVSGESPSINPNGALVALTKSMVRGEMKDDEVVVVAEVFGNGLARVDEVVEPSHDRRAVEQLQKALQSDPAYAPFVPAKLDRRSDSVRVVLRIQSVDVDTKLQGHRKL
jgi:hypothetical protein